MYSGTKVRYQRMKSSLNKLPSRVTLLIKYVLSWQYLFSGLKMVTCVSIVGKQECIEIPRTDNRTHIQCQGKTLFFNVHIVCLILHLS